MTFGYENGWIHCRNMTRLQARIRSLVANRAAVRPFSCKMSFNSETETLTDPIADIVFIQITILFGSNILIFIRFCKCENICANSTRNLFYFLKNRHKKKYKSHKNIKRKKINVECMCDLQYVRACLFL